MNVQINSVNLNVSQKIKDMVDKKLVHKLDQLLINFNEEIKTGFLHLERDKYQHFKTKFDIALPGKDGHLFAECNNIKLVSAIVGMREQLEKQIKKYKQDKVNYSLG
ncbi:MAG: HPF/RaiA family ribosome-associated protein [Candidatus Shapirobacteria bacterium]|nr:HPF/RaiA family ribosome-associated protein [Candidatus Shapirobacteria bacterium]MDD4410299.1 HPF/RaiA family ribosome-associated protein [Candidatus Shapirobacteria bacterium]